MLCNLMVFYKGALSYSDLKSMPIPELYELQSNASRMIKEIELERARVQKGS
jgi:hypothetical protein